MALIQPGPLVSAISGNIGGTNFAITRQGIIARRPSKQPNKHTVHQQMQRTRFSFLKNTWPTLSADQRKSWNAAALSTSFTNRLGLKKLISGANLFMMYNAQIGRPADFLALDAPTPIRTTSTNYLTHDFEDDPPRYRIFLNPTSTFVGQRIFFAARSMTSNPRTSFRNWRFIRSSSALGREYVLTTQIVATLGTLLLGEYVGLAYVAWEIGKLPAIKTFSSTQVAEP